MARIGYARVSTTDRDLDLQHAKLKAEGCGIIRSEKVSGSSREGRPELATIIEFLRPGDELVVKRRVDRAKVKAMAAAGQGPVAIATALGCSRMQVYRMLQET